MKRAADPPIAVIDFETDPFEHGATIAPFAAGYLDADQYRCFWGLDCADQLAQFLATMPARTIYAHNGGRFDYLFLLSHIPAQEVGIIGGRLVRATMPALDGAHQLRDSWSIIPLKLKAYDKGEIDYQKLKRSVRARYKGEILEYLERDCRSLFSLVKAFRERYGEKLTIASTALRELKKLHKVKNLGRVHDAKFRPYYFGGRVEHFERGILRDDWQVLDVNSMYPFVMANRDHPTGPGYRWARSIDQGRKSGRPFFVRFQGKQSGALPMRAPDGRLSFQVERGEFYCCSHELIAGLDLDIIRIDKVIDVWIPDQAIRFDTYVNQCMSGRQAAKTAGDKEGDIFFKLLANSAYGKFAQDPARYKGYFWLPDGADPGQVPADYDQLDSESDDGRLYSRPQSNPWGYVDVATAASITSAARAVLMLALAQADRPIYCDTDSIIARSVGVQLDQAQLGAWKLEAQGDEAAIAGRKLYALFAAGQAVKAASKGARLTPDEIRRVARGESIVWRSEAPSMRIGKDTAYLSRTIARR
jgi:hypothetical protein